MLDLFNNQVVSVDTARDHGFLEGMGIDPGSKTQNGQEAKTGKYTGGKGGDYVIACHQPTNGAVPGGKTAMENCLSANPDINVVYTINEPAADGANQALKAAGKTGVTVVTIDGSCNYVNGLVKDGVIAADAAQYPGKMASIGVKTIADIARGGAKPTLPCRQGLHQHRHGADHLAAHRRHRQPGPRHSGQGLLGKLTRPELSRDSTTWPVRATRRAPAGSRRQAATASASALDGAQAAASQSP